MRYVLLTLACLLFATPGFCAEDKKIEVFPSTPYDQSAIYLNLILFWIALVGLVVILVLKLREIERVQKMDKGSKEEKAPLLD